MFLSSIFLYNLLALCPCSIGAHVGSPLVKILILGFTTWCNLSILLQTQFFSENVASLQGIHWKTLVYFSSLPNNILGIWFVNNSHLHCSTTHTLMGLWFNILSLHTCRSRDFCQNLEVSIQISQMCPQTCVSLYSFIVIRAIGSFSRFPNTQMAIEDMNTFFQTHTLPLATQHTYTQTRSLDPKS